MDKTIRFVERAKAIHGDKYNYIKTEYKHSTQKVVITCPIHGDFKIAPNNHLSSKQGCQKCSKRHHYNQEEFILEAHRTHNSKYDYSQTTYVNNKTPINVNCPTHGIFSVVPRDHIHKKSGCPTCANLIKGSYHKKDNNWFIETARTIHGNKYDYGKVDYHRYHDKVEIICPEHGPFFQTAGSHIHNKNGCPTCSVQDYEGGYGIKRFDNHPEIKNNPAVLYVIRLHNDVEQFIKVGITQKTVKDRFEVNNRIPYTYEIIELVPGTLYNLFLTEQLAKKQLTSFKYRPMTKFNGHTECFVPAAERDLLAFVRINTINL